MTQARTLAPSLALPRVEPWIAVLLTGPLILFARRPEELLRPEFVWEEAAVFYVPTFFTNPLALLVEPWAGYLHLVPRLAYSVSPLIPPALAPLVPTLIAFAVVLVVAAFVASGRVPVPWVVGPVLALLPAVTDVHASALTLNWYLAIYLVALSVVKGKHWSDYVGAGLATLSGPNGLLLWPLFAWRAWRERTAHSIALLGVIVAGSLVQLALIVSMDRDAFGSVSIPAVIHHLGVVPLVGERMALIVPWMVGTLTLVLGALLVRREAWPWVYAGLALAVAGIAVSDVGLDPIAGERYFVPMTVAWAVVIAFGVQRRSRIAYGLAAILTVGIVVDFRLPAYPDTNWSQASRCIGSAEACTLPMHPAEWSVTWPGRGHHYQSPAMPP